MTKKNIAAMNEMEKVSGGMIWKPGMPDKPIPGGLWMASDKGNGGDSTNDLNPLGGKIIDIPPMVPPMRPYSPWPIGY